VLHLVDLGVELVKLRESAGQPGGLVDLMAEDFDPPALTDDQRLGRISKRLKTWCTYGERPQPVLKGSSFAADDAIFSVLPPSHLI
jgi:hypothetical protein